MPEARKPGRTDGLKRESRQLLRSSALPRGGETSGFWSRYSNTKLTQKTTLKIASPNFAPKASAALMVLKRESRQLVRSSALPRQEQKEEEEEPKIALSDADCADRPAVETKEERMQKVSPGGGTRSQSSSGRWSWLDALPYPVGQLGQQQGSYCGSYKPHFSPPEHLGSCQ